MSGFGPDLPVYECRCKRLTDLPLGQIAVCSTDIFILPHQRSLSSFERSLFIPMLHPRERFANLLITRIVRLDRFIMRMNSPIPRLDRRHRMWMPVLGLCETVLTNHDTFVSDLNQMRHPITKWTWLEFFVHLSLLSVLSAVLFIKLSTEPIGGGNRVDLMLLAAI